MDDITLAYLAGFVDGEGSIAIGISRQRTSKGGKLKRRWYLRFSVHQLDPRPLRMLLGRFGGSLRQHGYKKMPEKRRLYEWVASSDMAYRAIKELRPYLVVKDQEADLAIRFQETLVTRNLPRRAPLSEEEQAMRESLYLGLRALKKRLYDET